PGAPVPPQATVPQDAPVPPAGAPAAPQGMPQSSYQQPAPAKKSKAPIIIGAIVAVFAILAVVAFVVMPMLNRGPWTGSMTLDGVSASYNHEFGIKTDGKTMTIYDQDDVVTGTIKSTTEQDDQTVYEVGDVSWGSWGGSSFSASSVTDKTLTVMVPKQASAAKPYGRWTMLVTATDTADDDCPLYVRSTTLELDEDGTGYYEFGSEWGKSHSDVDVADPTSPSYDPASSGWKKPLTADGSNGSYDVAFDGDTFDLTFTDGR
ncbi:hypothetical protein, partial [uncultured Parolsenella sp.]|uniref:hypothetical protein n=1 Tax=uncultured Parolsenella sp. TaxID=2083008 RepID=UPI0027DE5B98